MVLISRNSSETPAVVLFIPCKESRPVYGRLGAIHGPQAVRWGLGGAPARILSLRARVRHLNHECRYRARSRAYATRTPRGERLYTFERTLGHASMINAPASPRCRALYQSPFVPPTSFFHHLSISLAFPPLKREIFWERGPDYLGIGEYPHRQSA